MSDFEAVDDAANAENERLRQRLHAYDLLYSERTDKLSTARNAQRQRAEQAEAERDRLRAEVEVLTGERNMHDDNRPWCCPEPRCTPIYSVQGGEEPLSQPQPGEMFICFGEAPASVEFIYDGVRHVNDLRQCSYTALKGLIAFQENADDWRGLQNAYGRALRVLDARRAAVGGSPETPATTERPKCEHGWTQAHNEPEDDGTRLTKWHRWPGPVSAGGEDR